METTMNFALRSGTAQIEVALEGLEGLKLTLRGETVAAAGVAHMVLYGIRQAIADGAAASKEDSAADQAAKFEKRLAKLIAGTIATRETSGATAEARQIAERIVEAGLKRAGVAYKKSSDAFKARVEECLEDQADKIAAVIKRRREEEAELLA